MRFFLFVFIFLVMIFPAFARDVAVEPSIIYDELLDSSNYKIETYNYPAGSRELNIFDLKTQKQYNLNSVVAPDSTNLVYTEVYFYPDPRVTASAMYIIPLEKSLNEKAAILSVSTKDKIQKPIKETDYSKLYPFKFNTLTAVDWNSNSDKILFKEKFGVDYDKVYLTKLYLYDLTTDEIVDLNLVRTKIVDAWIQKGVFLDDYKWDIVPLGFMKGSENKIIVKAFGYYKKERKFLGVWAIDDKGKNSYLLSYDEDYNVEISANGKCLKFIPDIEDIYQKQRKHDVKHRKMYIEPK